MPLMAWLSVQELSAVETLLEVNQKKGEMDEPTGVSIIKSECDVLDEEKEQLQEASAVTEEVEGPGELLFDT